MSLNIKSADQCDFDQVSLGECMIRLSPPGHGRMEFAKMLEVWVGGGEYNVAYALSRLGLRTGWVGGLVDNPGSFGSIASGETWLWGRAGWKQIPITRSPSARSGHAMAFDPARGVVSRFTKLALGPSPSFKRYVFSGAGVERTRRAQGHDGWA